MNDYQVRRGKIVEFQGSWMSGLGALVIDDEDRGVVSIPCENAQTVRCLEGAFSNVIGDAHDVKTDGGHVGQEVYYSMDEMGLILGAFTPVDEAPDALVDFYEKEREVEDEGGD